MPRRQAATATLPNTPALPCRRGRAHQSHYVRRREGGQTLRQTVRRQDGTAAGTAGMNPAQAGPRPSARERASPPNSRLGDRRCRGPASAGSSSHAAERRWHKALTLFELRRFAVNSGRVKPNSDRVKPKSGCRDRRTGCGGRKSRHADRSSGRGDRSSGRGDPSSGYADRSSGRGNPSSGCADRSSGRSNPSSGCADRSSGRADRSSG